MESACLGRVTSCELCFGTTDSGLGRHRDFSTMASPTRCLGWLLELSLSNLCYLPPPPSPEKSFIHSPRLLGTYLWCASHCLRRWQHFME